MRILPFIPRHTLAREGSCVYNIRHEAVPSEKPRTRTWWRLLQCIVAVSCRELPWVAALQWWVFIILFNIEPCRMKNFLERTLYSLKRGEYRVLLRKCRALLKEWDCWRNIGLFWGDLAGSFEGRRLLSLHHTPSQSPSLTATHCNPQQQHRSSLHYTPSQSSCNTLSSMETAVCCSVLHGDCWWWRVCWRGWWGLFSDMESVIESEIFLNSLIPSKEPYISSKEPYIWSRVWWRMWCRVWWRVLCVMKSVAESVMRTAELIEGNPPPRGGFLFTMFSDQEPGGRGPPLENHPQNWSSLGVVLQGGSSSSGFLIRKHSN